MARNHYYREAKTFANRVGLPVDHFGLRYPYGSAEDWKNISERFFDIFYERVVRQRQNRFHQQAMQEIGAEIKRRAQIRQTKQAKARVLTALKQKLKERKERQQNKKFLKEVKTNYQNIQKSRYEDIRDKISEKIKEALNKTKKINRERKEKGLKTKEYLYILNFYDEDGKKASWVKISPRVAEELINMEDVFDHIEEIVEIGSDAYTINTISQSILSNDITDVEVELKTRGEFKERDAGGFFPYWNKTTLDFSMYGIYKNYDEFNAKAKPCLRIAIEEGAKEYPDLKLDTSFIKNPYVEKKELKKIAEKLNITIKLSLLTKSRTDVFWYNQTTKDLPIIQIALLNRHYFVNNKTKYTSFAVEYYHQIMEVIKPEERPMFGYITGLTPNHDGIKYKKVDSRLANSLKIVKILEANRDLCERINDDEINKCIRYFNYAETAGEVDNIIDLPEPIIGATATPAYQPRGTGGKKQKYTSKTCDVWFADFEAYTRDAKGPIKHSEYLVCAVRYSEIGEKNAPEDQIVRTGPMCGIQLLNEIVSRTNKKTIQIYFHNLRYDISFLLKHLNGITSFMSKGNRVKRVVATFMKKKIIFQDSFCLISTKLSNFSKMFALALEKEIMPYDLYTKENINKPWTNVDDALPFIKEEDHKDFLKNIEEFKCGRIKDGVQQFHKTNYAREYCIIDCCLLRAGFLTFRDWIADLNIELFDLISSTQIAKQYAVNNGVFDGVYSFAGIPREFMQKCVRGGRVMISDNRPQIVEKILQDFDAVSLYPSAMRRLKGFLKGNAKVLTQEHIKNFEAVRETFDGYYIRIKVLKIDYSPMPVVSFKDDKNTIRWECDPEKFKGKIIYVDATTLEDAINFQHLEYEVINGYYFDEGYNNTICTLIQTLFETRLRLKKEGNPAQEIYKLIMNSLYGFLIQKPIEEDVKFFTGENEALKSCLYNSVSFKRFDKIYNKDGNIEDLTKDNKRYKTKYMAKFRRETTDQFSCPHLGSQILSMSKRIVNEVVYTALENGMNIYYTDTDSLHMNDDDVEPLSLLFEEKYDRKLIGKAMGEFHCDFNFKHLASDSIPIPYSQRAIFLGKKMYCDEIVHCPKNKDKKEIEYHIRFKGQNPTIIKRFSEDQKFNNPFELYEEILKGKKYKVDRAKYVPCFMSNPDMTMISMTSFERTMALVE